MGRFKTYVKEFEQLGFKVDLIDKKSAVFTCEPNIKFTGTLKRGNNFEVSDVDNPEKFEDVVLRLNRIAKYKRSNILPQEVIIQIIDRINNQSIKDTYFDIGEALTKVKLELVLNLTKENTPNSIGKIKYLLVIIPKSSRVEFISDLQCIISDMKQDNCSSLYIWFIVMLHLVSVAYHAFFFKLKDYFYPSKQQSNKK